MFTCKEICNIIVEVLVSRCLHQAIGQEMVPLNTCSIFRANSFFVLYFMSYLSCTFSLISHLRGGRNGSFGCCMVQIIVQRTPISS